MSNVDDTTKCRLCGKVLLQPVKGRENTFTVGGDTVANYRSGWAHQACVVPSDDKEATDG